MVYDKIKHQRADRSGNVAFVPALTVWLYNTQYKVYKTIASEVFNLLNNLNFNFMNTMFQVKYITYD